jgi:hypothetical protein
MTQTRGCDCRFSIEWVGFFLISLNVRRILFTEFDLSILVLQSTLFQGAFAHPRKAPYRFKGILAPALLLLRCMKRADLFGVSENGCMRVGM